MIGHGVATVATAAPNRETFMTAPSYNPACGGLPPQTALMTGRAVFTEAYAVLPHGVMSDIVTSLLPGWERSRAWILARPLSGFAETFAQYLMEVAPGGGSERPEPDPQAEGVLFVVEGTPASCSTGGPTPCGRAATPIAPGAAWSLRNDGEGPARFHWVRKAFERAGPRRADSFVTHESAVEPASMPGTDGAWATTRFVSPDDCATTCT